MGLRVWEVNKNWTRDSNDVWIVDLEDENKKFVKQRFNHDLVEKVLHLQIHTYPFIYTTNYSSIHLSILPPNYSSIHPFFYLFIHSFICSFFHLPIYLLINPSNYLPIYSSTYIQYSFIYSSYLFIHLYIHLFVCTYQFIRQYHPVIIHLFINFFGFLSFIISIPIYTPFIH